MEADNIKMEIFDYKMKGYCCSQIIMDMGLKRLGIEDQTLVDAMAGLCFGMNHGKNCGILSAGMCLLNLADPEAAGMTHARDLLEWFEDAYGAIDCDDLLEGDPLNKVEKCPLMIENTFMRISEMLDLD
jgi:hypothetical protein